VGDFVGGSRAGAAAPSPIIEAEEDGMIDHVGPLVSDLALSKRFDSAASAPLDFEAVCHAPA
jgi:hypothetical protein